MTPKDRAFAALRYEWRAHRSVWLGLAFAVTLLGVLHGALTGDLLGGVFLGLGALSLLAALLLAFLSLSLSKLFPKAQRCAAVLALLPLPLLFSALAILFFFLA